MKPNTLPVRRRPAPKGVFKKLNAVTQRRKQRAATAAAADYEPEDSSAKISRALTIIFLIHIVVIGLIFFHQRFLDKSAVTAPKQAAVATAPSAAGKPRENRLSAGDKPYLVKPGDNYARIAAANDVNEADLRAANNNADLQSGFILKLPPKRIVAMEPPEVAALRNAESMDRDRGLVEVASVETEEIPRAILVHPKTTVARSAAPVASGESYTVQAGDSVWRISNRFNVDQEALMKLNGISDARKLKLGMTLKIPR